jgi:hypothetical protein
MVFAEPLLPELRLGTDVKYRNPNEEEWQWGCGFYTKSEVDVSNARPKADTKVFVRLGSESAHEVEVPWA